MGKDPEWLAKFVEKYAIFIVLILILFFIIGIVSTILFIKNLIVG